jgi:hypothetical protein
VLLRSGINWLFSGCSSCLCWLESPFSLILIWFHFDSNLFIGFSTSIWTWTWTWNTTTTSTYIQTDENIYNKPNHNIYTNQTNNNIVTSNFNPNHSKSNLELTSKSFNSTTETRKLDEQTNNKLDNSIHQQIKQYWNWNNWHRLNSTIEFCFVDLLWSSYSCSCSWWWKLSMAKLYKIQMYVIYKTNVQL